MEKEVQKFLNVKKNLLNYFGCKDDYHIRPIFATKWTIKTDEGVAILSTFENENRKDFVVVCQNSSPLLFKKGTQSLIICIDCVKLGFILDNNMMV